MKDLSFVIPAYNAENVIEKCLHEILKIKKIDIEVVVVDDGSVDSTPTIVQKIGDERIRLLTQKNRGVSQARNNGIKNATGKYIAFVDADDYIYPDIYEEVFANINSEIDFTMFQYESMNGIHKEVIRLPLKKGIYTGKEANQLIERLYDYKFSKNYKSGYFGGKVYQYIYKKQFLEKNAITFKEGIHFAEDCLFCLNCFKYVKKFQVIEKVLYCYIVDNTSASHRYRENFWKELTDAYKMGSELYGQEFKNTNEIYFAFGDQVIQRTVKYGLQNKKNRFAVKKVKDMILNDEFQTAIKNVKFTNWTEKEKLCLVLYKNKLYRFVYVIYMIIMVLKYIKSHFRILGRK